MKSYQIKLILCLFFIEGCSSWKNQIVSIGNENEAIKNVVIDFINTEKLVKQDSVFSICVKNINDGILGISISCDKNKVALVTENEVDYNYRSFPTNYIEQNGKLFYWKDSTKRSLDLINILYKMNRVDTAIIGKYLPDRMRNDSQKGTDYYFCKSNLRVYKKVRTSIAMGWYKPPKLKCPDTPTKQEP